MYRFAIVAAALMIAGCGVSESKFGTKAGELTCEKLAECDVVEEQACLDLLDEAEEPDVECDYDKKKAKECLDGIKAAECPAEGMGFLDVPACADVNTNCM